MRRSGRLPCESRGCTSTRRGSRRSVKKQQVHGGPMMIPKDEQEGRDFDWFGVDADGHIAHFTTAGFKYLPGSVSGSAEDLQQAIDYFDNEAPIRGAHTVDSESISQFKEW